MHLQTFYQNYSAIAANNETLSRSHAQMIDEAISGVTANGSFDYAECNVTEGVWSLGMATDYLVSKAIGFIDLSSQEFLRQDLFDRITANLLNNSIFSWGDIPQQAENLMLFHESTFNALVLQIAEGMLSVQDAALSYYFDLCGFANKILDKRMVVYLEYQLSI